MVRLAARRSFCGECRLIPKEKNVRLNQWGRLIVCELFISFLTGGLPLLIGYGYDKEDGMIQAIGSLMPIPTIILYSMMLTFIAALLILGSRAFLILSDTSSAIWNYIEDISSQIMPSMLTILRISGGLYFTSVVVWYFARPDSFSVQLATPYIKVAFFSFSCSLLFRRFDLWLESMWPAPHRRIVK